MGRVVNVESTSLKVQTNFGELVYLFEIDLVILRVRLLPSLLPSEIVILVHFIYIYAQDLLLLLNALILVCSLLYYIFHWIYLLFFILFCTINLLLFLFILHTRLHLATLHLFTSETKSARRISTVYHAWSHTALPILLSVPLLLYLYILLLFINVLVTLYLHFYFLL